jgi:two-component system chemotaxis response regulator CheB
VKLPAPEGRGAPVSVLVADDDATELEHVLASLARDPDVEVVAAVRDGDEAVAYSVRLRPDVVALDTRMPRVDGFTAARRIMEEAARPVLLLASADESRDPAVTRRALEAGALMLVPKPPASNAALADTIRLLAGVRVVTRRRAPAPPDEGAASAPRRRRDLVAIAASTGGPAALAAVLGGLTPSLPVPIVLVQHISAGFDRSLATWLERVAHVPVRLAEAGAALVPGEVRLAPADVHLGVTPGGRQVLSCEPPIGGHRPSATFLFRSVARSYGPRALAVILTGMGRDGVAGLADVVRAGGRVLAQDESSSVVYGMPGAAVALGAAHRVLHLCDMADAIRAEIGHDLSPV